MLRTPFTKHLASTTQLHRRRWVAQSPSTSFALFTDVGGLGMQGVSWHEPGAMVAEIVAIRRRTARPFAVNLGIAVGPAHAALFGDFDAGAPVISLFWGDPTAYFSELRAARGQDHRHRRVGRRGQARRRPRCRRSSAHRVSKLAVMSRSKVGTMVLLPVVVDAVAPRPVIAAGGIADGRGLAAVLALGGAGAWIGTRFLATPEAYAHDEWKRRIVAKRGKRIRYVPSCSILAGRRRLTGYCATAPTISGRPRDVHPPACARARMSWWHGSGMVRRCCVTAIAVRSQAPAARSRRRASMLASRSGWCTTLYQRANSSGGLALKQKQRLPAQISIAPDLITKGVVLLP